MNVEAELRDREPIFHRSPLGSTRAADPAYDPMAGLEVSDFACRDAGDGTWLVTYRLRQDAGLTRRLTVWRRVDGRWIALYRQGTIIS